MNKLRKGIKKISVIQKINKNNNTNKKVKFDDIFDNKDTKKKLSLGDLNLKKTLKKNKTESLLSSLRKQQEKENKDIINHNAPKFKQLKKFITNKIFVKYLTTSYIILCILRDCIAFCSNNFHWVCYTVMILNHIMSSSIISLFYPLSIFCYALMEYPRPKRGYWSFCLIYTVTVSTIKFIIQFRFLSGNSKFFKFIENTQHYKLGLKICTNTFSKDFFIYILFDSLVLIILLINDYLLVSRGLFLKREQEIENIYQAMERIAITKDICLEKITKIQKFNDKYLLKEEKKREKNKNKKKSDEKESSEDEIDNEEDFKVNQRFEKAKFDESEFIQDKEKHNKKKKQKKKHKKEKDTTEKEDGEEKNEKKKDKKKKKKIKRI